MMEGLLLSEGQRILFFLYMLLCTNITQISPLSRWLFHLEPLLNSNLMHLLSSTSPIPRRCMIFDFLLLLWRFTDCCRLEKELRNFSCLTKGEDICIEYNKKKYYLNVLEGNCYLTPLSSDHLLLTNLVRPDVRGGGINIVEADIFLYCPSLLSISHCLGWPSYIFQLTLPPLLITKLPLPLLLLLLLPHPHLLFPPPQLPWAIHHLPRYITMVLTMIWWR